MRHLTLEQRYALKAYLECGKSKNETAELLGVDRSTVYRELKRNSGKQRQYNRLLSRQKCQVFLNKLIY